MAKNRSARAHARKSTPAVLTAVEAENVRIAPNAAEMLAEAEAIIDAEAVGTRPEPAENNPDVVDSERGLSRPTEHYTDPAPVEVEEVADKIVDASEPADPHLAETPAPEGDLSEQALALARDTETGRMLASRFPTAEEALAYAGNMKLRNYSISRQDDGQYAILIRKQASATKPVQAPVAGAPAPAPRQKSERAQRVRATAPRPDTRNAVIWAMLTRAEGTTHKEVVAAMDAFERARGRENLFPTGIGSDWKLFSNRFGYDRKKSTDADGATRYFCFPFSSEVEDAAAAESAPEASESESASESAAS